MVDNKAIHDTFLSLKNITKGDIEKKCPWSLCFQLLFQSGGIIRTFHADER